MSGPADPIVLDSSVLVAYERMKTPGAGVLHEAQSRIAQWLLLPLLVPALSLVIASHECGGELPELDFLHTLAQARSHRRLAGAGRPAVGPRRVPGRAPRLLPHCRGGVDAPCRSLPTATRHALAEGARVLLALTAAGSPANTA